MCEVSPVRKVLEKCSITQVEAVRDTASARAANAPDKASADVFRTIAAEADGLLADMVLSIVTRDVLAEAGKTAKRVRTIVGQMVGG
jgi:hypothetical protein